MNETEDSSGSLTPTDIADLQDLFEHAPCGYLSISCEGRIVKANQTLANWLGSTSVELIGKTFPELLNIAGRIFFETHFSPLLRMQGSFNEVALDLVTKHGERLPVLVNAIERRTPAGEVMFTRITIFNATDRRRYESEILASRSLAENASNELERVNAALETRIAEAVSNQIAAEASLRQSQKMEAIGQLTGGVAHDFNNLLTVILGGVDSIRRKLDKMPDSAEVTAMRRSISMAKHSTHRAASLIAKLMAFARQQPLAPTAIEPNKLMIGMADLLERTLGETISIETISGAGLWRAFADAGELENAILNLAVNARDAMPQGGRLTIETGNASLDESYVAGLIEPVPAGQYVLIAVTDTGHGMAAATLAKVFEPFFTTKEVGKGTGLGLSQVYGFIRQSGGHVRVYSEVGEGTTVRLYLPRAGDATPVEQLDATLSTPTDGGVETILVVEDHDDLRAFSAGTLRELGYRVIEAASAAAALDSLERHPEISLLFTDVILPGGMDGRRLADKALVINASLKVLFTTGYTKNAIVHNGRLDPDVHLLGKPFSYEELALKVRSILDL